MNNLPKDQLKAPPPSNSSVKKTGGNQVLNPPSQRPEKPVTIYQVAAALGVSTATVSRAFSRPGRIRAETANWVRAEAQKMGYKTRPYTYDNAQPNRLLTVEFADIRNEVFLEFIAQFQTEAYRLGYLTSLFSSQEQQNQELAALHAATKDSAGLTLVSPRINDQAITQIAKLKPLVIVNRKVDPFPCITVDHQSGMRKIIDHLQSRGHNKILYLSGPADSWNNALRWKYLWQSAGSTGITIHKTPPLPPDLSAGKQAYRHFLEHRPSAVVAFNDLIAISFIHCLEQHQIQVPQSVAVIGMDNTLAGRMMTPALTSLHQPNGLMGKLAARTLISTLKNQANPHPATSTVLPCQLFIRQSTAVA